MVQLCHCCEASISVSVFTELSVCLTKKLLSWNDKKQKQLILLEEKYHQSPYHVERERAGGRVWESGNYQKKRPCLFLSTAGAAAANFSYVFVCRRSEVRSVTSAQIYNLLQVKIETFGKYRVDFCRNEWLGLGEENIHYNMKHHRTCWCSLGYAECSDALNNSVSLTASKRLPYTRAPQPVFTNQWKFHQPWTPALVTPSFSCPH